MYIGWATGRAKGQDAGERRELYNLYVYAYVCIYIYIYVYTHISVVLLLS